VAQLVASFVGELSSPLVAVGEAAIDLAPPGLKDFAIQAFGANDKTVLLIGIGVLLGIFAVAMGILATRRRWIGYAGLVGFGAIGVAAALTRPTRDTLSPVPSIVGIMVGAYALRTLFRTWHAASSPVGHAAARSPVAPGRPARQAGRTPTVANDPLVLDRRRFLLTSLALGGAAVVTGLGAQVAGGATSKAVASRASLRIPKPSDVTTTVAGSGFSLPGLSSFYTPNATFYRVDTAIVAPKVTAQDWSLRIHGMVDREIVMSFAELLARPLIERDVTLTCVSNPVGGPYIGNARWIGAPIAPILQEVGVHPAATQLVSRSVDGFTVGTPVAALLDGRDAMLAVAMNGEPLPIAHGFPVRMVIPGLYGYVSATKWVVEFELTTFEAYDAYWVPRGWAQQAPIKTESRIDTPRRGATIRAGTVSVAGVAWAQHRGIDSVEVQVDDGPWRGAELATQDSIDTWRLWRYEWNAAPGSHKLRVRATDRSGRVQTAEEAPPPPNGATGWHTVDVTVTR
jgi:DMSO/TMAO reductase YedYZ molybdopterin-dependent catalytic subunit